MRARYDRRPPLCERPGLAVAGLLPVSDEKISFEYKVKRMLEGSLLPANEAHFFWNGTWSAAQRRFLLLPTAYRELELPGGDPLYVDQLNYLPDDILYKTDRMSMAHSLEVRPPFLDHRIVEFAARLPRDLKIRGSKLKWILRELMRDKLPSSVLTRSKQGFDIPTHQWFRTILKPLLLETVNREAVESTVCSTGQPFIAQSRTTSIGARITDTTCGVCLRCSCGGSGGGSATCDHAEVELVTKLSPCCGRGFDASQPCYVYVI
jgi:hypothetical protein